MRRISLIDELVGVIRDELIDPIERAEADAEDWAVDNINWEAGTFKCNCGRNAPLEEMTTISPDPFAIPVCKKCEDEYRRKHGSRS